MKQFKFLLCIILFIPTYSLSQLGPDSTVIKFHEYVSEKDTVKIKSLFSSDALKAYSRYQNNLWKGIFDDFPPLDSVFVASKTDSAASVFTYSKEKVNQLCTLLEDDNWKITFPIFTRIYDRDGLVEIDSVIYSQGNNRWSLHTININNGNPDVRYALFATDKEFFSNSSLKERLENMVGKECLTIVGGVSREEMNEVWEMISLNKLSDKYPQTRGRLEKVYQSGQKFGDPIFKLVGRTAEGKGFMIEVSR